MTTITIVKKIAILIKHPLRASLIIAYKLGIQKKPLHRTVKTVFGEKMSIVLPEGVSSKVYLWGHSGEQETISFLKEQLKPGSTFLDVGAHIGFYSLLAAKQVGKEGSVHSFEPTPTTFEFLQKNCSNLENITLNNVAVFSKESKVEFIDLGITQSAYNSLYAPRLERSNNDAKRIRVKTIPLDLYVKENSLSVDCIKIDVEDAEYDALLGLENTLTTQRPALVMEVGDFGNENSSTKCIEYLKNKGYRAYEYKEGVLVLHETKKSYTADNLFFLYK